MRRIDIEFVAGQVRVDGDKYTHYSIPKPLLKRYYENSLDIKDLEALGFAIYEAIFATDARRRALQEAMASNEALTLQIIADDAATHDIPFELINKDPELDPSAGFC